MVNLIDTHVHVWDIEKYRLPWLDNEGPVLNRTWSVQDYLAAQAADHGYRVEQAVYIEVDMAHGERPRENALACEMVADPACIYGGACIAGDLSEPAFASYIEEWGVKPQVKGVRHVLHVSGSASGTCLGSTFVDNVRRLGSMGLVFEACMRCPELGDLVTLAKECPDTTIVLDHMGNMDSDVMASANPTADECAARDAWKASMRELGALGNVVCKVSGLNPAGAWTVDSLARTVDVALDAFDAESVMFASNFPVLNVAMTFDDWVCALLSMTEGMDAPDRAALMSENARRVYTLGKQ